MGLFDLTVGIRERSFTVAPLPRPDRREIPNLVNEVSRWGGVDVIYKSGEIRAKSVEYIGQARGFSIFLQFNPIDGLYKLKLMDIFADSPNCHAFTSFGDLKIDDLYALVQKSVEEKPHYFNGLNC
jgi:hypothetical protein